MEYFCNGSFWDYDLIWNTDSPQSSTCFQKTILASIPCLYLCLFSPLEIILILRSKDRNIPTSLLNATKLICSIAIILLMLIQLYLSSYAYNISINGEDLFYPTIIAATVGLQIAMILIERKRGIQTSGVIFTLWLTMFVCLFPLFYGNVSGIQVNGVTTAYLVFIIFYSLVILMLFLNCFADKEPLHIEHSRGKIPCPEANASFLSQLTFSWLDLIILKGFRSTLGFKNLWNLSYEHSSNSIVHNWERNLNKRSATNLMSRKGSTKVLEIVKIKQTKKKSKDSIFPILCRTFGPQFLLGALLKLCTDILQFVAPLILSLMIGFIEDEGAYMWQGYIYAVILFINGQFQTFFLGQYFKTVFIVGMKTRSAVVSSVYKKALRLSNSARKHSSVGEIVNLMSVDAQRFMELITYLNMIWSAPLQITLASIFLWHLLGPATLAGIAVMVVLIPVNVFIANRIKHLQSNQMKQKDLRVKLMNEILNGIKVIKLYAWEIPFADEILNARKEEIKYMSTAAYYNAGSAFIWSCAPFLVSIASFGVYTMTNEKPLDAHLAFVSLSVFNLLSFPISSLSSLTSYIVQAKISLKRMNKFLNEEELDTTAVIKAGDSIGIKNGTLSWENDVMNPTLKDINLEIKKGKLVGIVGSVGSGKSSLCSAFLGEMNKISGSVNVYGTVAYAAQQAWIQNDTFKNNILFGKEENPKRYSKIIDACALKPDVDILPGGHDAEIGEKGLNLSGGQKQRVSLGRAVYADNDIYILDDPLSAVDSHVGKHIFENVIGPHGLLRKKTRIFVTHSLTYLRYMDHIVVMKDGSISEQGSYEELIAKKGEFQQFIVQYFCEKQEENEEVDLEELKLDLQSSIGHSELARQISNISVSSQDKQSLCGQDRSQTSSLRRRSSKIIEMEQKKVYDEVAKRKNRLTEEEKMEVGKVPISVYESYAKAAGWISVFVMVAGFSLYHTSGIGTNVWLAEWTKDTNGTYSNNYYLGIYGIFGVAQGISIFIASVVCYYGTFMAGKVLHDQLLNRVLLLPMSFFDTNPVGRILNRFSKDIDTLDITMPFNIRWCFSSLTQVIATIVIIMYTTPTIVTVIIPTMIIYCGILILYVATSRQLKRIESVTRSPIYSHFGETVQGAATIRAYGKTEEFILNSQKKVDENQQSYYPFISGNRWLAMRLETIANIITFSAGIFAVISKGNISAGDVGLSLSYALQITQVMNWFVRMCSEIETNLVSVERINEYFEVEPEADWEILPNKPPPEWPEKGRVSFHKYATRYREGLPLVVKEIDFEINPAEKIGIVGRTGAGKSSLTLGLFRIIEPSHGTIFVDGIDISTIGLHDLRSRLTIIPQDPVLFSGTLRMNLDPFNVYTDEKLWNALENAHLKRFIIGLPNGLQHQISESGENLSVGQRQLVCLARALLRKTKVLILDEATAAVDMETDDLIQQTIRREFTDCTVLTIAHRLNTIMDANKVLVLDSGRIKEYDSPTNLLAMKTSSFYSMAKDADLV